MFFTANYFDYIALPHTAPLQLFEFHIAGGIGRGTDIFRPLHLFIKPGMAFVFFNFFQFLQLFLIKIGLEPCLDFQLTARHPVGTGNQEHQRNH